MAPSLDRVAVIGGGPAGLAAARWLEARGFAPLIFEQSERLGGLWANGPCRNGVAVDRKANTTRAMTRFSDLDYPAGVGRFPTAAEVAAYLHAYAAFHVLTSEIRLRTSVDGIARHQVGGWMVRSTDAKGGRREEVFCRVVVATGYYSERSFGRTRGADLFAGRGGLCHAADYDGPQRYEGMRVLVVGAGTAALSIAADLAGAGVRTALAMRTRRETASTDERDIPPAARRFTREAAMSAGPNVPVALAASVDALAAKEKLLLTPAVGSITGSGVYFADGTAETYDAIVMATGYRMDFSFLAPRIENMIAVDDERLALCDHTFHPELDGLAFIGLYPQVGPAFPAIELQARAIAYRWSGALPMPPREALADGVFRALTEAPPSIAALTLRLARLAGADSDPAEHPELARVLRFGPLTASMFRLSGFDALPDAAETIRREAADAGFDGPTLTIAEPPAETPSDKPRLSALSRWFGRTAA